jgi:hypothetical protein
MEANSIFSSIPSYKAPNTPRSAFFDSEVAKNLPKVTALRQKREAYIASLASPNYIPPQELPISAEDRDRVGAMLLAFAAENKGVVTETDLGFDIIFPNEKIGKLRAFYDPSSGVIANSFPAKSADVVKTLDLHPAPDFKTNRWMFSSLTWRGYRTTNLFESWSIEVARILA